MCTWIREIVNQMKPTKPPKPPKPPKPTPAPAHDSVVLSALFRIEMRQIWQNRQLRCIRRTLAHGNPAETQAMRDQVQKLIDDAAERTQKLQDAVPPQEEQV